MGYGSPITPAARPADRWRSCEFRKRTVRSSCISEKRRRGPRWTPPAGTTLRRRGTAVVTDTRTLDLAGLPATAAPTITSQSSGETILGY